jgi:hypothetical protein
MVRSLDMGLPGFSAESTLTDPRRTGRTVTAARATEPSHRRPGAAVVAAQEPALSSEVQTTRVGQGCYASARATWTRADNTLVLETVAESTSYFAGCRAAVDVDLMEFRIERRCTPLECDYFPIITFERVGSVTRDLATACSRLDPTCPSVVRQRFEIANPVPSSETGRVTLLMGGVRSRPR